MGGDRMTAKKEMKMLLLGTGESGKSTILKQMVLIYNGAFKDQDRHYLKETIFSLIAQSMHAILKAMPMLNLSVSPENDHQRSVILSSPESHILRHQRDLFYAIRVLWSDPSVKEAVRHSHLFHLNDSAVYYFDSTERISSPGYLPTDEDILRSSVMTTGIFETTIKIGELTYKIFDTGGQKSERKKWIHCLKNATTLVFVVSLSEYNQMLYEDENQNRMQDSLIVFESLCKTRWYTGTSIILLLNKIDLFAEKLHHSPLGDYFPDYIAGDNFDAACNYLRDKFLSKASTKQIYAHYICATDTRLTKSVLSTIQDQLLQLHLRDVQYLV
ncbi:hypothetical protein PILCRDRAFT_775696 [Piloderma croceum F 1598]|uniref:Uncharacterized protein n=1 Tax=Piloderma croceum (strain F 1598) TaxID=765440 RepID=A0A0C3G6Q1_PILCF|nr:hypothetical protein PILCRDRAFT_775696 [Piloderma croceum F 1598]